VATRKHQSVLVVGKSQRVLDEVVAGLRDRGYTADATNDFSDVVGHFDPRAIDLVVFGGRVPPGRKAALREEISAVNPNVVFVQGLAGIPGLIINQIQGALAADHHPSAEVPTFTPTDKTIRFTLAEPAEVTVTAWWQTSFVPPDPQSDSRTLLDRRLEAGDHLIAIPDQLPTNAIFASVQIDCAIVAFTIATNH
jgi:hypothetical protein